MLIVCGRLKKRTIFAQSAWNDSINIKNTR